MNKYIILLLNIVLISGCSNSMYRGSINDLKVENNIIRSYSVHWYTNKLATSGEADKKSLIFLQSECSNRNIKFTEELVEKDKKSILFIGNKAQDRLTIEHGIDGSFLDNNNKIICGKVGGYSNILDIKSDNINIFIYCESKNVNQRYLPASNTPYNIIIKKESVCGLSGKQPESPNLSCRGN